MTNFSDLDVEQSDFDKLMLVNNVVEGGLESIVQCHTRNLEYSQIQRENVVDLVNWIGFASPMCQIGQRSFMEKVAESWHCRS